MRRQIRTKDNINILRRGLVTGLLAGVPIAGALLSAASKSAAQTAAPKSSGIPAGTAPAAKTVGTPTGAAAQTACSTSDTKCCYYSEIQGDLCCPNLKTGPTRANITPAQFRAMRIKHGDLR